MIGQKLGNRYEIVELIGEGATATVYKGTDLRLQRTIAVKVLLPYVDDTTRRRFQREALAAAQLNHPSIMAIYDVGDDEQPYLIIEYIEGRPLYDLIPSPPEVVAEVGRQICLALDYAHGQQLIHRDIKPANVHITPGGQVKIMDFGLAISGASKRLTATGRIIGTPAYLSPEQAQGMKLTFQTDIYSTAVVLYEMVTGRLPFDSDDIGMLLLQQVKKAPQPPREFVPDIPEELEHVILRALSKKPEARFESAGAMAAALAQFAPVGEPSDAHPTPDAAGGGAAGSTVLRQAATGQKVIRVALADDHRVLRMSLAMFLNETEDIEVVGEADNGKQALDIVSTQQPDVLLLDLDMPGMSGLEALPQIRKAWPNIRVLVLTGQADDSYIMRALRAGAHGYILKTTEEQALIQAVRDVMKGHMVLGHGVAERVAQGFVTQQSEENHAPFSDLDRMILCGIAAGLTNDKIAERLRIDPQLIDGQLTVLIGQLGAKTRTETSLIALRRGVISLDDVHNF